MSEPLVQVRGKLAKWLYRRFGLKSGSMASEQILDATMDQLVAKFGHNLGDPKPILTLGYTIVERRAIDYLRSRRASERRLVGEPVEGQQEPLQVLADREMAWKVMMAGVAEAKDESEREFWFKWSHATMYGERVNLGQFSKQVWPDMHSSHASRVLALPRVANAFPDED